MKNQIQVKNTEDRIQEPEEKKTANTEYREMKLDLIMPSPTNPRKSFPAGPLADLAESIKMYGIKQPILIRALTRHELLEPDLAEKRWHIVSTEPDGLRGHEYVDTGGQAKARFAELTKGRDGREFEIVCGERRYRAAILAKLTSVPCSIEALGDREAREIQQVENFQREDLNAIEEALGYKALMDDFHYSVKDLQARLGKSRSHIFAKLALLKLSPAVRKALEEGKIEASVAELVGRFEIKQQEEALEKLLENGVTWENGEKGYAAVSFRQAKRILEHIETTIPLQAARFDVAGVYAPEPKGNKATECLPICAVCPARSGNCKDEWPELGSPDVCTQPSCFHQKTKLAGEAKLAGFAAKGLKTIPLAQSQKLFTSWGDFRSNDYVTPDQRVYEDKKQRTVEEILGKSLPAQVMLLDAKLKPVKVYPMKEVQALLAEKGIKKEEAKSNGDDAAERKAQKAREEALAPRLFEAVRGALRTVSTPELQVALVKEIDVVAELDLGAAMKALDVGGKPDAFVKAAKPVDLMAALLLAFCHGYDGLDFDHVTHAAIGLGVDVKAQERAYDAEVKAKAAAEKKIDTKGTKETKVLTGRAKVKAGKGAAK